MKKLTQSCIHQLQIPPLFNFGGRSHPLNSSHGVAPLYKFSASAHGFLSKSLSIHHWQSPKHSPKLLKHVTNLILHTSSQTAKSAQENHSFLMLKREFKTRKKTSPLSGSSQRSVATSLWTKAIILASRISFCSESKQLPNLLLARSLSLLRRPPTRFPPPR